MAKYEYRCMFILGMGARTGRRLTELGRDGWELVCVWWCWHYLRRAVEE